MHFFINPSVFNREVKKNPVLIGHLFSTRMFSFLRMADEFNLMPFDPWPQKCDLFWVTSTFCPFYFNISSTVTDIKPKNTQLSWQHWLPIKIIMHNYTHDLIPSSLVRLNLLSTVPGESTGLFNSQIKVGGSNCSDTPRGANAPRASPHNRIILSVL